MRNPFAKKAPEQPEPTQEEREAAEAAAAQNKSDRIDAALNDPRFTQFLEKYGEDVIDNIDTSTEGGDDLLEKYEVYQNVGEIAGAIKDVLRQDIYRDTEIRLSNEEMQSVDDYLEQEAIDGGMARLNRYRETITQFINSSNLVAGKEAEIAQMRENYDQRQEAFDATRDLGHLKRNVAMVVNKFSLGRLMGSEAETVQKSQEMNLDTSVLGARKQQRKLDQEREGVEAVEKVLADLESGRQAILEELADAAGVMSVVREKVREKLMGTLEKDSVSTRELDTTQSQHDQLHERYREALPDDFQANLDRMIRNKIKNEAREAVKESPESKRGQLSSMEKKLDSLFQRRESGLGSMRSPEEIRDFIGETLAEICDHGDLGHPKKLLLRRVCAKNDLDLESYRRRQAQSKSNVDSLGTSKPSQEDNPTTRIQDQDEAQSIANKTVRQNRYYAGNPLGGSKSMTEEGRFTDREGNRTTVDKARTEMEEDLATRNRDFKE